MNIKLKKSVAVFTWSIHSITISLIGADAISSLPGELAVNNTGKVNYSIPIEVSPGREGMQPDLSVEYSSGGGDGFLGRGWSLSGLSSISLVGKNFAQDQEYAVVQYDPLVDRLALDGQRLVCVDGIHGTVGSEYRTEVESFSRITALGSTGLDGFKVESKDGLFYYYGAYAYGSPVVTENDAVIKVWDEVEDELVTVGWALKAIEDRYGNFILFEYDQTEVNGKKSTEYFPTKIRYTGGSSSGFFAEVEFVYDPNGRSDQRTGYAGDLISAKTKKLDRVDVKVGSQLMNRYSFDYFYGAESGNLLLEAIGLTAYNSMDPNDSIDVPETTFVYQHESSGGMTALNYYPEQGSPEETLHFNFDEEIYIDLNGDNVDEEYYLRNGPQTYYQDIDGDGENEFLRYFVVSDNDKDFCVLDVFKIEENTEELTKQTQMSIELSYSFNRFPNGMQIVDPEDEDEENLGSTSIHFADFNGDGQVDVLHYIRPIDKLGLVDGVLSWIRGGDSIQVLTWEENSWSEIHYENQTRDLTYSAPKNGSDIQVGDFDKDGIPEVALIYTNNDSGHNRLRIQLLETNKEDHSTGVNLFSQRNVIHESVQRFQNVQDNHYTLLDFTQDGVVDLMVIEKLGTQSSFSTAFNLIEGMISNDYFMDASNNLNIYYRRDSGIGGWDKENPYSFFPLDIDNDGRMDFLQYHRGRILLYESNLGESGPRFTHDSETTILHLPELPEDTEFMQVKFLHMPNEGPFALMDVNRDGYLDIVRSFHYQFEYELNYPEDTHSTFGTPVGAHGYHLNNGNGEFGEFQMLYDSARGVWNGDQILLADLDMKNNTDIFFIDRELTIRATQSDFNLPTGNQSYPVQDLLVKVVNGLGIESQVEYHPLNLSKHPDTDKPIYYPEAVGAEVQFPIITVNNGMPVATRLKTEVTPGEFYDTTYRYRAARVDAEGRGFLGFEEFSSYDEEMNTISVQQVAHQFPATGMVTKELVFYTWGPGGNYWNENPQETQSENWAVLSESINDILICGLSYENGGLTSGPGTNTDGITYYPVIRESISKKFNPSESSDFNENGQWVGTKSPYSTTTTKTWFDGMSLGTNPPVNTVEDGIKVPLFNLITAGNITQTKVTFDDGLSNTTLNTYADNEVSWELGRLSTATVTHSGPTGDIVRESAFDYDSNGLLRKEEVEPNVSQFNVIKEYQRNGYGSISHRTKNGDSGDPEIPSVHVVNTTTDTWDGTFRFPTKTSGPISTYENHFVYEPFRGKVISQTGPNQKTSTAIYDALGRQVTATDIQGLTVYTTYTLDSSYDQSSEYDNLSVDFKELTSYAKTVVQKPNAPTVTTYYDRHGRVLRTLTESLNGNWLPEMNTRSSEVIHLYDKYGRNVAKSEVVYESEYTNILWTTTSYDPLGRQVESTTPHGVDIRFGYNGRFNSTVRDYGAEGIETEVAQVDSRGNIIRAWNPGGGGSEVTLTSTPTENSADLIHEFDSVGNLVATKVKNETGGGFTTVVSHVYDSKGYFKTATWDMAMGTWTYLHDAYGRLRLQTDAKGQSTGITYDVMDRVQQKSVNGVMSYFEYYDSSSQEAAWIGALKRTIQKTSHAASPINTQEAYYYDDFGRSLINLQEIDGKYFYTHFRYDENTHQMVEKSHFWRPKELRDNYETKSHIWESFGINYTYSQNGALTKIMDSQGKLWWYNPVYDRRGRVKSFTNGNGTITTRVWDEHMQTLSKIETVGTGGYHQRWTFDYYKNGNLKDRIDTRNVNGHGLQSETLQYDERRRMTHINGVLWSDYDELGNLSEKKGFGASGEGMANYTYHANGAINNGRINKIQAGGQTLYEYVHDANGNITTRFEGTQAGGVIDYSVQWTAFNKPLEIAREGNYSRFVYDANQSRVVSISKEGSVVRKQLYITEGMEQIEVATSANGGSYSLSSQWENWSWEVEKTRIYISGPTGMVGSFEFDHNLPSTTAMKRYWYHQDHLGSIDAITTATPVGTASLVKVLSYDAWGMPRADAKNWGNAGAYADPDTFNQGVSNVTDRGYTGHEMLAETGLVHMNGRIYDPLAGRFLSPDPHVQFPNNIQNYNRYSYVLNNPLSYTDPSGYFLKGLFKFVKRFFKPIFIIAFSVLTAGVVAGLALGLSPWLVGAVAGFAGGFVGGFLGALVHGGDLSQALSAGLTGGLWGALSGGLAGKVGQMADKWKNFTEMKRALAHGLVGGAISSARGGNFASGFFAGFASSSVSHANFSSDWTDTQHVLAAALVGGTASRIGGGSFENGAMTGAFQYMFNAMASKAQEGEINVDELNAKVDEAYEWLQENAPWTVEGLDRDRIVFKNLSGAGRQAITPFGDSKVYLDPGAVSTLDQSGMVTLLAHEGLHTQYSDWFEVWDAVKGGSFHQTIRSEAAVIGKYYILQKEYNSGNFEVYRTLKAEWNFIKPTAENSPTRKYYYGE